MRKAPLGNQKGLTYFAIPAMVPLTGAQPVFADIGHRTHVLDPEAFRASITQTAWATSCIPRDAFSRSASREAVVK